MKLTCKSRHDLPTHQPFGRLPNWRRRCCSCPCPIRFSQENGRPIIKVAGSGGATNSIGLHHRREPLYLKAAEISSKIAYQQSGLSPQDIDFFELHDAFSIMAALSLEASGFADRGQGPRMANDGSIYPTGRLPIATRGGLKARGHPVGATGCTRSPKSFNTEGEADGNQLQKARIGMTQNIGGSGSYIITHIFQKVN